MREKYTSNFPETADIETSSADYANRFSGATGEFLLSVQRRIILNMLTGYEVSKLLSVGGAHGQLLSPLIRQGFDITVTGSHDICYERLKKKMRGLPFSYQTCDSINLPFADDEYDVVFALRLLTHVSRWQELIAEMCRVARKSIIFDYPDRRSSNILYKLFFPLKKALEKNTRPFAIFNRAQLSKELEKNGYIVDELQPQFFLPMVFHRKLAQPRISEKIEAGVRLTGLTTLLGSPIILKSERKEFSVNCSCNPELHHPGKLGGIFSGIITGSSDESRPPLSANR